MPLECLGARFGVFLEVVGGVMDVVLTMVPGRARRFADQGFLWISQLAGSQMTKFDPMTQFHPNLPYLEGMPGAYKVFV